MRDRVLLTQYQPSCAYTQPYRSSSSIPFVTLTILELNATRRAEDPSLIVRLPRYSVLLATGICSLMQFIKTLTVEGSAIEKRRRRLLASKRQVSVHLKSK
jgi:hypothetical protein